MVIDTITKRVLKLYERIPCVFRLLKFLLTSSVQKKESLKTLFSFGSLNEPYWYFLSYLVDNVKKNFCTNLVEP